MTSMSAADVKNHFMQIFGPDLGAKYYGLRNQVIHVNMHWAMIRELVKSEERRSLLKTTGGYFFITAHRIFGDDVILRLTRFVDRAKQRGQDNLSLRALLGDISDPYIESKIRNLIEEAERKIAPLKVHRHKRIAHFDLRLALNDPNFSLPPISNQSVDEALSAVGEVLGQLEDEYAGTSTVHEWVPVQTVPEVEGLLYYLEDGLSQDQSRRR